MAAIAISSCGDRQSGDGSHGAAQGTGGWLSGDESEKFEKIAGQLRGFDMAMVEVGYRYQELFWAGNDGNWDYARYQTEKIRTALENGFQRKPKRKKSATHFMSYVLPQMEKAIDSRDTAVFNEAIGMLTSHCNSCHTMEKVPFFTVKTPEMRQSPIRK